VEVEPATVELDELPLPMPSSSRELPSVRLARLRRDER
jgi:hypothetical protein